ncbi:HD domain-containing protein [Psychroserpens sp. AS72]|uniref:HD domain-containing protein n=1 Tax=Psychroserpens sp. AS72 TaxID=3135775 RepID=UPI0031824AF5
MKTAFPKIYGEVVKFLDDNLPEYLTYHNTKHTLYVLEKAEHIAKKEHIKPAEIHLLKIAALYHDIGYVKSHDEHEKESCAIAKRQLKTYGYSKDDIDAICGMIMATKIPQSPKNKLQEILADADLEYLATSHFQEISDSLFQELKHYDPSLTIPEWDHIQIDFIKKHTFHTSYCRHYKSFRKHKNLEFLKSKIK